MTNHKGAAPVAVKPLMPMSQSALDVHLEAASMESEDVAPGPAYMMGFNVGARLASQHPAESQQLMSELDELVYALVPTADRAQAETEVDEFVDRLASGVNTPMDPTSPG